MFCQDLLCLVSLTNKFDYCSVIFDSSVICSINTYDYINKLFKFNLNF